MFTARLLAPLFFAATAFAAPEWEDETISQINREPHRASLLPTAPGSVLSLNGDWRFHYVDTPAERPEGFHKPEFGVSSWKTIPVPSSWQVQGYGTPLYSNAAYPFNVDPPRVTGEPDKNFTAFKERNPVGSYRRDFTVADAFAQGQTFLRFDGVESAFYVWLNGAFIGYSEDAYTGAEFNVTPHLRPGKNTLAVQVYRWSDGSYLEDQDFFRHSGIFRDVTLFTTPNLMIRDVFLRSGLDRTYTDGTVDAEITLRNHGETSAPTELLFTLGDLLTETLTVPVIETGKEITLAFGGKTVPKPLQWSAEIPNLYPVNITLAANGDSRTFKTGFRTVETGPQGQLLINGKSVILKGVNYHDTSPDHGRAIPFELMVKDIRIMKENNINTVRNAHYPRHPKWYELCDEHGIYVVDEANIEAHGLYGRKPNLSDLPTWEHVYTERVMATVERSKNHPSVIFWSLGNETAWGKNFAAASDAVRARDTTRLIHYCEAPWGSKNTDMDSIMYPSLDRLEAIGRENTARPFFVCEYAHSMGNAMGNFEEYVALFKKYPRLIGGCIWDFADQSIRATRDPKTGRYTAAPFTGEALAWGGMFGDNPNSGDFCDNGIVTADRKPKGQLAAVKKAYQPATFTLEKEGKVTIRNDYAFKSITYSYFSISDGRRRRSSGGSLTLSPGEESTLCYFDDDNAPETTIGILERPLTPKLRSDASEDLVEYALAHTTFTLPPSSAKKKARDFTARQLDPAQFTETNGVITVTAGDMTATFANGTLTALTSGEHAILTQAPDFRMYRARTCNDVWISNTAAWRSPGMKNICTAMTAEHDGQAAIRIMAAMRTEGSPTAYSYHLMWTVAEDFIRCDGVFTPTTRDAVIPRLGFAIGFNKAYTGVTYRARGPWETYPDRKAAGIVDTFLSKVCDFYIPYSETQEYGNREDAQFVALHGGHLPGIAITTPGNPFSFSVTQWDSPELAAARTPDRLPTPDKVMINLNHALTGLGNASCGPRPLPQYQLRNIPFAFSFNLTLETGKDRSKNPVVYREVNMEAPYYRPTDPPFTVAGLPLITRGRDTFVTIASILPGLAIAYTLNGDVERLYEKPFKVEEGTVTARVLPAKHMHPSPALTVKFQKPSDEAAWRILGVSSEEPGEGNAINAIDGDPYTFWHSNWQNINPDYPHFIAIDLGAETAFKGFTYTPRGDMSNGAIGAYRFETSPDAKTWIAAIEGAFRYANVHRPTPQTVVLPGPVKTRYIRLTALSPAVPGQRWANAAEIQLNR